MSFGWSLNKLEKITEITYIPGTPAIPGSEGTVGTPAYSYWKVTTVPGGTYTGGPPTGYDVEITVPLAGGGTQTVRTGGYRYFNGEKAYLQTVIAGITYVYKAPSQEVYEEIFVPAVPSVPATPPVPATPTEIIEEYNLGWNSGAHGPATLAVNKVFTWRMSAGNVGAVVGLTLSTAPQDNGYTGMSLSIMAQSGNYQIYRGGSPVGSTARFTNATKFAFSRTNEGTIEVFVDGGLIHTEALPDDVVVDTSLYSGGDVLWDAVELDVANAPLNSNLAATTASDAQAVGTAIAVTRTVGPGTAIGVAGATTASKAVNGQVNVNGTINTGGIAGTTATDAVSVDAEIGAVQTFGAGTAKGVAGSTTASDAVAAGDATTGVGISTNTSVSADMSMLPLTAAGSPDGVNVGWTGNYVGDSMNMLPMTSSSAGDLAAPGIGIGACIMVPMNADIGGVTGEVSLSSSASMLPLSMFASSETTYAQGYVSMHPLTGLATDEFFDGGGPGEGNFIAEVTDGIIVLTTPVSANYVIKALEQLAVATSLQTYINYTTDVAEAVALLTTTRADYVLQVAEQYNITDAITITQALNIIDALLADGAVETAYQAIVTILSAIGASDNKITGGSATGATAGVSVQDFGPPSVEFTFTGYWQKGTIVQLGYTTDVGPGYIEYTYEYAQMGPDAMALFAVALDAQPLVNAIYDGTSVTMTAQAPATTVQL